MPPQGALLGAHRSLLTSELCLSPLHIQRKARQYATQAVTTLHGDLQIKAKRLTEQAHPSSRSSRGGAPCLAATKATGRAPLPRLCEFSQ